MNWTWNIRSNDGAMNGLEFARCTTAGGFGKVLVHAAPGKAKIEVIDSDDHVLARADLERSAEYSPMTLLEIDGPTLRRSEVWPTEDMYGVPVLLAGGEVGILQQWQHAEDHSWWRWSVEFSNHTGPPTTGPLRASTSAGSRIKPEQGDRHPRARLRCRATTRSAC